VKANSLEYDVGVMHIAEGDQGVRRAKRKQVSELLRWVDDERQYRT
jgi:hypothetical protein